MSPWRKARSALGVGLVSLIVIILAPAVLLAGEAVNRHYWRGTPARQDRIPVRRRGLGVRRRRVVERPLGARRFEVVARVFLVNPVWIALTAPARWVLDHLRPRAGSRRRRGGNGPPGAGVREPRRPLPDLPAAAMALPEPYPGAEGQPDRPEG
jgi:hypothetical protein